VEDNELESYQHTLGKEFMRAVEFVSEAFNQPYKTKSEKSEYGDVDMLAKLPDGTNLSIMFSRADIVDDIWGVEFYRNNSQEVTGEGDAQRIFATVLTAIQKFIKKYQPQTLFFTASKELDPSTYYGPDDVVPNPESRAKLYDRLVQRYAKAWGYRAFRADTGTLVRYELSRLSKDITESKTVEYEGLTLKISKNGHQLMVNALDDWGNKVLGHVTFNIGDGKELDPQDLKVDDKYQGQGIARVMYDYVKSLGYTIVRSYDQTDAGKGFWDKHRGEEVRVWEQGVPQPGPSSGAPKQFGPDAKIETRQMTVKQIISSIPGVPYYNNVVDDYDAKDYSWGVTKKSIEYANYLKQNPKSLSQLPPILVLNGKFEDGAHRVSAIWLLQQRMDVKNPLWANTKLNVQFVTQDVTEGELEEDWKSALATGAMAGAMAMGANAKAPQMVHQLVEPGDTVYSIARQNNVNPLEIYKLNKMNRNTKLEIGQKVLVPDYSKPVSKMPATVQPAVKQEPAKVAQPTTSFKDKLTSMIPKFSRDEEDGVILLSNNSDAEAALQTAAKAAGLKGVELAQFMAQTRHESWDFSKMKEVGNKKKFDRYEKNRSLAKQLGNKVKGDGELFKGRGPMQLTGRDNYTKASQQIFGDDRLVKHPDLVSNSLEVGAKVALWYWKNRVRPKVDDFNNTVQVVKAINANEPKHVVQQRHTKFKEYLAVL
jgi:predicted chitinase